MAAILSRWRRRDYSKEITYNDCAFEGIMELLKDIINKQPQYDYLEASDRKNVEQRFCQRH